MAEKAYYAHDAHCNTLHEAGPEPCPPARDNACRLMPTRNCPAVYNGPCGERPCARFESDDQGPWLVSWSRQNGKTVVSEHINALQARIAELERQRDDVIAVCQEARQPMSTRRIKDICEEIIVDIYGGGE